MALRVGRKTNIVTAPAASPAGTQTSNCFNGGAPDEEAEASQVTPITARNTG
jgi:hypothetical protein